MNHPPTKKPRTIYSPGLRFQARKARSIPPLSGILIRCGDLIIVLDLRNRDLVEELYIFLIGIEFAHIVVVVRSTPRLVRTIHRNIQAAVVQILDTLAPELDALLEVDLLDQRSLVREGIVVIRLAGLHEVIEYRYRRRCFC